MPHRLKKNVRNRILAALPAEEFALIVDNLHLVQLTLGESSHRAGEPIENVFFVESGFISASTILSDGAPLEIGLIGAEGAAGVDGPGSDADFSARREFMNCSDGGGAGFAS